MTWADLRAIETRHKRAERLRLMREDPWYIIQRHPELYSGLKGRAGAREPPAKAKKVRSAKKTHGPTRSGGANRPLGIDSVIPKSHTRTAAFPSTDTHIAWGKK